MVWHGLIGIGAKQFRCGYCGYSVANDKGYFPDNSTKRRIYLCPNCDKPTFFDENSRQFPGVAPGGLRSTA
jgi:ribosomal protein S27AE